MKENSIFNYSIGTKVQEKHFEEMLGEIKGARVLDLGCGSGHHLNNLYHLNSGTKLFGIDRSFEALKTAERICKANLIMGDVQELPFKDNAFDRAIFSVVIEHVENDRRALDEIFRVCKNGAIVVTSAPALEGLLIKTKLKRLTHEDKNEFERHFRHGYFKDDLIRLLELSKIKVKRVRYAMFLLAELLMELTKVGFVLSGGKMRTQTDVETKKKSFIFKVFKFFFPFTFYLVRLEERIMSRLNNNLRLTKGHLIIIQAEVKKD